MNPGIPHLWMMVVLCLVPSLMLIFRRSQYYIPSAINGLLLIPFLCFISLSGNDPYSIISTSFFVVFLIAPLIIQKKISERIINGHFDNSKKLLILQKLLSPAFPSSECKDNIKTLEQCQKSALNEEQLLSLKATSTPSISAAVQTHFLSVNWAASDKWLNQFTLKEVSSLPWLSLLRIRVDCEINSVDKALEFVNQVKNKQNQLSYYIFHMIYLCSFSGHLKGLQTILNLESTSIPATSKEYWGAVAKFHNEDFHEEGREILEELSESTEIRIGRASSAMLNNAPCSPLSPEKVDSLLDEFTKNFEDYTQVSHKPRIWTVILILINIVFFSFTFFLPKNGPHFDAVTNKLAMKLPEMVESSEYYRLFTATFIHSGPLHIFSNMAMLLIFGYLVETHFKFWKFLLIYFGAGIAGMFAVFVTHASGPPSITLGASGCTMAMLGAYIAVLFRQNSRLSIKARKQQLILLSFFVIIQIRMDLLSPQISFTSHIVGLAFGLIAAYFLYKHRKPECMSERLSETNQ